MKAGYDKPLFLLPFDHRHSYAVGMFGFTPPLTRDQHAVVSKSKRVIYDGFRHSLGYAVPAPSAGIMIDEEFGADIARHAVQNGCITALATEKSGSPEFEFEYGSAFAEHIEAFAPTFAKVLVRYDPAGDETLNRRQIRRLRSLSDYCASANQLFMFELLAAGRTADAIIALQDAGIEPDVWKVEGFERREDGERIVAAARRDGRDSVGCIVLGSGADVAHVVRWLETAAGVPGFIGFAVGRTTFWNAIADFVEMKVTRAEAVQRIADRFRDWAAIFEHAKGDFDAENSEHHDHGRRHPVP